MLVAVLGAIPASLVLTASQALLTTPLILQAEVYETGIHLTADSAEYDWMRLFSTFLANLVLALGFGLMLSALYVFRRPTGLAQGLSWGLAGLTVFFLAPSLGLPPELPGTEAASLISRQAWWLVTVICTASGLALLFLQQRGAWRLAGLMLLVIPHLGGVLHPDIAGSLAPESLILQFRLATLACNTLFWLLLGTLTAFTFLRVSPEYEQIDE